MESSQPSSNGIASFFSSNRRRSQTIVFAMIAVVGFLIWFNVPTTVKTCELIQGCRLRSNDLHRMQVALGQAGLNDFDIENGCLLVPKNQRDVYLKAITDGGALPQGIAKEKATQPTLNPFLTSGQHEQMRMSEKEERVREMLAQLPFVDQAMFEMDRVKSRNSFQTDQQSAVVMIRPKEQLRLTGEQVDTIRRVISGAIAVVKPEDIVVTDLNAGAAYQSQSTQGTLASSGQHVAVSDPSTTVDRSIYYENRIRSALDGLDGVQVSVQVEPIFSQQEPADLNARTRPKVDVIQVGTNGQAVIEHHEPTSDAKVLRKPTVVSEKVTVEVQVPEAILLTSTSKNHSSMAATRMDHAYRAKLDEVEKDIVKRIRPLLPAVSFANQSQFPIEVKVIEEPLESIASSENDGFASILQGLGGPWGGIAVLFGAGLILAFIFSGSRQSMPESSPSSASFAAEPSVNSENAQDESIKQEISKLIEEDPEAAAQVIKRWIRNAA